MRKTIVSGLSLFQRLNCTSWTFGGNSRALQMILNGEIERESSGCSQQKNSR
jgi:hypothetical protein